MWGSTRKESRARMNCSACRGVLASACLGGGRIAFADYRGKIVCCAVERRNAARRLTRFKGERRWAQGHEGGRRRMTAILQRTWTWITRRAIEVGEYDPARQQRTQGGREIKRVRMAIEECQSTPRARKARPDRIQTRGGSAAAREAGPDVNGRGSCASSPRRHCLDRCGLRCHVRCPSCLSSLTSGSAWETGPGTMDCWSIST